MPSDVNDRVPFCDRRTRASIPSSGATGTALERLNAAASYNVNGRQAVFEMSCMIGHTRRWRHDVKVNRGQIIFIVVHVLAVRLNSLLDACLELMPAPKMVVLLSNQVLSSGKQIEWSRQQSKLSSREPDTAEADSYHTACIRPSSSTALLQDCRKYWLQNKFHE